MANKEIKGISIQIGADTTPLDKALSEVNSKALKTQNELTKVNKLLKFDTKNTELLAQKQQLLTNQISNTKEKLDKLKGAEAEVQDQFKKGKITEEQYRAYQREIQETTNKLKYYEDQLKETGRQTSTFAQKIDVASEKLSKIGTKMTSVGKGITTKLTVPLLAVGGACAKMSMDFEDSMAQINTLLDNDKHLNSYKNKILEVSNKTGIAADVMSKGMYQAISSLGDNGKETEKIFSTMANSARAGGAEVSESVSLISAGMKGYGNINDKTAKKISDIAFTTAKLGVTTFPEMASSMQALFPLSSSLGLSMEELFGSMATLTGVTGNTSEVSTQLKAVMSGLMKPTKAMGELIQKYGYNNAQAMIESEGLSGVLQILQKETGGQSDKMAQLFGSTEALTAMTALTGQNLSDFETKMKSMKDATGATDEALKKVDKPRGQNLKKSLNKLKNTAIQLGEVLSPMIENISNLITSISEKFEKLSPKAKEAIVKIGLIAMAIGPLLVIGGKMAMGISKIIELGTLLAPVLAGLSASVIATIGVVIVVVAGLIAIGVLLYKNWDKIMEKAHELKEKVCEKFEEIKSKIHEVCNNIAEKWEDFKQKTAEKFQNIKQAIIQPFTDVKQNVLEKVEALKTSLAEKWDSIKVTAKDKFESVKNFIVDPINRAKEIVSEKLEDIKNFFSNLKISEIKIPHIKLPHFKLDGEFSLKNMTVPKLSVTWNAQGAIFTKPYIFGNQGVGEAGPEAVLPISKLAGIMADTLNKMQVKNSVVVKVINEQEQMANKRLESNQKQIITMLERYLPEYLNALDVSVVLDDKTLVGKLTPKVDSRLGSSYKRKVRGNV